MTNVVLSEKDYQTLLQDEAKDSWEAMSQNEREFYKSFEQFRNDLFAFDPDFIPCDKTGKELPLG